MVDNCGRGYSLPCARRTLDQTEGTLQHCLHSIHLHYNKAQQCEACENKTKDVSYTKKTDSYILPVISMQCFCHVSDFKLHHLLCGLLSVI